jgi:hypothetical protein
MGLAEHLYPELLLLESKSERKEVLRSVRQWHIYLLAGSLGLNGFTLGFGFLGPGRIRHTGLDYLRGFLSASTCFLLGLILAKVGQRKIMRRRIRERLRKHGIHLCLNCGYDLRGNRSLRCAECGTEWRR